MNYLIKGNDIYRINQKINNIINKLNIDLYDIHKYDGSQKDFNFNELINDLNTTSMFNENKIIIFNNPMFLLTNKKEDDTLKKDDKTYYDILLNYINKPIYETTLIIYSSDYNFKTTTKDYKNFIKNLEVIDYSNTSPEIFKQDAYQIIKNNGINISKEAIELLIKNSNNSYSLLNDNINKLKLYGETINKEAVINLTDAYIEDNIFEFTNAIFAKNINNTFNILEDFFNNNYSVFYLISILTTQLRFYHQVSYYKINNKTINDIMHLTNSKSDYRIKKAFEVLSKYRNLNFLKQLSELAKLDQDLKSNTYLDERLRFELFLINLMKG